MKSTKLHLILFLCLQCILSYSINFNDIQGTTDDEFEIQRVRLNVTTTSGMTRHLLLAFIPNNQATDGIDYGYDAPLFDDFPNDCNWIIEDQRFVINGAASFSENKAYPLGLFLEQSGEVSFSLFQLENFHASIPVYIYDSETNMHHSISDTDFTKSISSGVFTNRFYLTFTNITSNMVFVDNNGTLNKFNECNGLEEILYLSNSKTLLFKNIDVNEIEEMQVFNLNGQLISEQMLSLLGNDELNLNPYNLGSGYYVLRLSYKDKILTKKFLIGG
ncbi:MAG: T9SS type A sorting domain-containing protein [Bacteroidota bacterium]